MRKLGNAFIPAAAAIFLLYGYKSHAQVEYIDQGTHKLRFFDEADELGTNTQIVSEYRWTLNNLLDNVSQQAPSVSDNLDCGENLSINNVDTSISSGSSFNFRAHFSKTLVQCDTIKTPTVTCMDSWINLPFGGKTKGVPKCRTSFRTSVNKAIINRYNIQTHGTSEINSDELYISGGSVFWPIQISEFNTTDAESEVRAKISLVNYWQSVLVQASEVAILEHKSETRMILDHKAKNDIYAKIYLDRFVGNIALQISMNISITEEVLTNLNKDDEEELVLKGDIRIE